MKWQQERLIKPEYFRTVIYQKECELILFFLQKSKCRFILIEPCIQEFIIKEYIPNGEHLYYGAEMLMYIYKNKWKGELTKELCQNVIKTLKSKDILNCHSPILTCLLLVEFINQIKEITFLDIDRGTCEETINELLQFCKIIQKSSTQESYIRYLMKQKDTKGRNSFQIVSNYSYFSLLETPEIGTIVKKMWKGKVNDNGFMVASSMHRYIIDHNKKPSDSFISFDILDNKKVYFFQLAVWLNSCSVRFQPIFFFSFVKVIIYNLFIYKLNDANQLLNTYDELEPSLRLLLDIYIFMTSAAFLDFANKILFSIKTKRSIILIGFNWIDLCLFILAWMIPLDVKSITKKYCGNDYNQLLKQFIWGIQIPITKEVDVEIDTFSRSVAFLIRSIILALNDLFVWIRVCGVLLTYRQIGPVIRMILSMVILLLKYLLVISFFLFFCSIVFNAIFNVYSKQFESVQVTIITLFGGFLNDFDLTDFAPKVKAFGAIMFMIYICITSVLLVNLLIAVLVNSYEKISTAVDASNRALLIQYYRQYKWDDEYGFLIFLPPPLSLLNFIVFPFFFSWLMIKKKQIFS